MEHIKVLLTLEIDPEQLYPSNDLNPTSKKYFRQIEYRKHSIFGKITTKYMIPKPDKRIL